MDLSVIILTFNEEIHIKRAIESVSAIAKEVIVVDSFSTDNTLTIATEMGARILQHTFINQAHQFQWALDNGQIQSTWVLRLDADEYLLKPLVDELIIKLPHIEADISGIILKRRLYFMGKWIRYGGYYPVRLLRIWRHGHAKIEQRWMDEHVVLVQGKMISFHNDFVDENKNSLTWWTNKHNEYATREAVEWLNQKYNLKLPSSDANGKGLAKSTGTKRWYKNNLYYKLPLFLRVFLYFLFRFWIRLGFLDGRKGLVWHFLQGFWYRFLVDAKILQIEWWAKIENKPVQDILKEKYNFILED